MELLSEHQVSGKVLDHLGLISATIEKLGLVEKIDSRLSVSAKKGCKVSMGKRIAAMILNGFGFIDDRLYMFPEFLSNKPIERLLGDGLIAENFNDDALGRSLDAIYEYGTRSYLLRLHLKLALPTNKIQQYLPYSINQYLKIFPYV